MVADGVICHGIELPYGTRDSWMRGKESGGCAENRSPKHSGDEHRSQKVFHLTSYWGKKNARHDEFNWPQGFQKHPLFEALGRIWQSPLWVQNICSQKSAFQLLTEPRCLRGSLSLSSLVTAHRMVPPGPRGSGLTLSMAQVDAQVGYPLGVSCALGFDGEVLEMLRHVSRAVRVNMALEKYSAPFQS